MRLCDAISFSGTCRDIRNAMYDSQTFYDNIHTMKRYLAGYYVYYDYNRKLSIIGHIGSYERIVKDTSCAGLYTYIITTEEDKLPVLVFTKRTTRAIIKVEGLDGKPNRYYIYERTTNNTYTFTQIHNFAVDNEKIFDRYCSPIPQELLVPYKNRRTLGPRTIYYLLQKFGIVQIMVEGNYCCV